MFVRVFGALAIENRDGAVAPPRGLVGELLRVLLVRPNDTIVAEQLIEHLWPDAGDEDPSATRKHLHVLVSRLRRFLRDAGDDEPGQQLVIRSDSTGYRLVAGPTDLDRLAFEAAVAAT